MNPPTGLGVGRGGGEETGLDVVADCDEVTLVDCSEVVVVTSTDSEVVVVTTIDSEVVVVTTIDSEVVVVTSGDLVVVDVVVDVEGGEVVGGSEV
jgi:hypothetical protein